MAAKKKPLKIQASSVSRIQKCPASLALESKLKDKYRFFAYKEAAEYGTLCHKAGEELILNGEYHPQTFAEIENHPRRDDIEYTAHFYADVIDVHVKKLHGRIKKLSVEEKYRAMIGGVDCVAKCDCYILHDKGIRIFDLKSGRFDYTESATAQMNFAGDLFCQLNTIKAPFNIECVTVQPMFFNESQRVVQAIAARYTPDYLPSFVDKILKRIKEYNPGSHCKMCPSILICPKIQSFIKEVFEMAKKETKEDVNFKELYMMKDGVQAFFDALDNYLKTEMESGKRISGLYLEEYSGHRRWLDVGLVKTKLAYLKDKIFESPKLKSPAQLEKIAGKITIEGLYETPKLKRVAIRENIFEG